MLNFLKRFFHIAMFSSICNLRSDAQIWVINVKSRSRCSGKQKNANDRLSGCSGFDGDV